MKTIVFTFGRMSPPTKAHEMLINKVIQIAKDISAEYQICVSRTVDENTNPLTWDHKVEILENIFPDLNILKDSALRNPFEIVENYGKLGYKKVVLVVGSDRVNAFHDGFQAYTHQWGISDFSIVSAGERDDDLPGGIGVISGTNARQYAYDNDYKGFCTQLSENLSEKHKHSIFDKIRETRTLQLLKKKNQLTL